MSPLLKCVAGSLIVTLILAMSGGVLTESVGFVDSVYQIAKMISSIVLVAILYLSTLLLKIYEGVYYILMMDYIGLLAIWGLVFYLCGMFKVLKQDMENKELMKRKDCEDGSKRSTLDIITLCDGKYENHLDYEGNKTQMIVPFEMFFIYLQTLFCVVMMFLGAFVVSYMIGSYDFINSLGEISNIPMTWVKEFDYFDYDQKGLIGTFLSIPIIFVVFFTIKSHYEVSNYHKYLESCKDKKVEE